MGNVNERENTILRKNIELLEKGITVKKYLQLEKEFMIRGSTEIYMIIPGLFEPPVRTLRATIPENESHIFR